MADYIGALKAAAEEGGFRNIIKDSAERNLPGRTIKENRSVGERVYDASKHLWQNGEGAGKATVIGAGLGVGGAAAYGISSAGQDHPLGTGAAVIGTAVALAVRPGNFATKAGRLAAQSASDVAKDAQVQGAVKLESNAAREMPYARAARPTDGMSMEEKKEYLKNNAGSVNEGISDRVFHATPGGLLPLKTGETTDGMRFSASRNSFKDRATDGILGAASNIAGKFSPL